MTNTFIISCFFVQYFCDYMVDFCVTICYYINGNTKVR
nr:MAG TPA: hypothetical protein [Caudoviricetes sp.]